MSNQDINTYVLFHCHYAFLYLSELARVKAIFAEEDFQVLNHPFGSLPESIRRYRGNLSAGGVVLGVLRGDIPSLPERYLEVAELSRETLLGLHIFSTDPRHTRNQLRVSWNDPKVSIWDITEPGKIADYLKRLKARRFNS